MEHTEQTLLVGDLASEFAFSMGCKNESLTSEKSEQIQKSWKQNNCQPNYWLDVTPDPKKSSGPYQPIREQLGIFKEDKRRKTEVFYFNNFFILIIFILKNKDPAPCDK